MDFRHKTIKKQQFVTFVYNLLDFRNKSDSLFERETAWSHAISVFNSVYVWYQ